MIRTIVLTLSMALIAFVPAWGKLTHFITVDESGKPVPGVKVKMSWTVTEGERNGEVMREEFVSNSEGRICTGEDFCPSASVEWVGKDGYSFESYLNLQSRGPFPPRQCSVESPFKFVLRKVNPQKVVTIVNDGDLYGVKSVRRGERSMPAPLWVVRTSDGRHHAGADCFALPEFDEVRNSWKCTFWTTNVNGGVFVTTNRVFFAPEIGYQKRIEVPLEMCRNPSFTLYVKTFNPVIYAMFCLHGFESSRLMRERISLWDLDYCGKKDGQSTAKQYGILQVESCMFNPFGGRWLEPDYNVHGVEGLDFDYELLPVLMQHRYPLYPDVPARVKGVRERLRLIEKIQEKKEWLRQVEERRGNLVKTHAPDSPELKKTEKEIENAIGEIQMLSQEKRRTEEKLTTLNLPSGGGENDNCPKKTE